MSLQATALAIAGAGVTLLFTGASAAERPLEWRQETGFRSAPLRPPTGGSPERTGFTLLGPGLTGVAFTNHLSDTAIAKNRLLEIGSGVALGDVDGDDRVDIYLCGLERGNALYRNLGNWTFEDITARAGVACAGQFSTGSVLADLDGDGDLDLLVNGLGAGTRAFLNDGTGVFREILETGFERRSGATSAALADIEGDGDLDVYVTHYRVDSFLDAPPGFRMEMRTQPDGSRVMEPRDRFVSLPTRDGVPLVLEMGEPDALYVNRGSGRFARIPWNTGLFLDSEGKPLQVPPTDWGLSVMFRDLNGDRWPDLYICNDFVVWPDRLWFNEQGRRFRAASRTTLRSVSLASMAMDIADVNRDGRDDFFVADMLSPSRVARAWQRPDTLNETARWPIEDPMFRPEVPRNTLHLARDDGTFAEIAQLAGVSATDWTPAALFLDVDLDGWEDLLITAGNLHDLQDADALAAVGRTGRTTVETRRQNLARLPSRARPGMALRNQRDLTFADASEAWGFNTLGVAHGIALGDLDNDGDLDVVVSAMDGPARLYRNDSTAARIAVRLRGSGENTRGIGARISVLGGPVAQSQEIIAGGRYASSDDPMRVFAAGEAKRLTLEVHWRSGRRTVLEDALPGRIYEIHEAGTSVSGLEKAGPSPSLFTDVSHLLNHRHEDASFDDFARHPLLTRKFSALGPGIAWVDLDDDAREDLVIGAGGGSLPSLLRSTASPDGRFEPWDPPAMMGFKDPEAGRARDQTTVLATRDPVGGFRVLVGESYWEQPVLEVGSTPTSSTTSSALPPGSGTARSLPSVRIHSLAPSPGGKGSRPFQGAANAATGPMALADVDGDGDLDLFIGGRLVPGRYPEAADSHLLRARGDEFELAQVFESLGLVSGAVFSDLDLDGDPDLALACEWDSIRILRNDRGTWTECTRDVGLGAFQGWWNGIAAGDFDGDGRMDLVASNWGRNWRTDQAPGVEAPVHLAFGEFAGDGVLHTLLASDDPITGRRTPWRERKAVVGVIPAAAVRAPTHHAYGEASVEDLLGDDAARARWLRADTFDSAVFLNRGDHFEFRPLPIEAQFAPAFGVSVADFDGDGREDVFLAQNFFGIDPETSRQDAGTGLVLLGDGRGGFRALGPAESGIAIHGESRGSALADFDRDGRVDLAVTQHGGPTRLFRNARGTQGVRVRLRHETPGNPHGVGAIVRIGDGRGEDWGPAREIHAGSGYGSQDSATLTLSPGRNPRRVQVRWPWGQTATWDWPGDSRSVEISAAGIMALDKPATNAE